VRVLVFGGTRYFGLRLVKNLLEEGVEVTVATTGTTADPFGGEVRHLLGDRSNPVFLGNCANRADWDVVYDQIGFSSNDAHRMCDAFEGKTKKIVFTSSSSVYHGGADLKETDFNPYDMPIRMGESEDFFYPEGKRLTEAAYFQRSRLPVVAVRFPIVLGTDDYTGRLEFHVERIRDGAPIYVPNPDARMSFVDSEDAARFLCWLKTADLDGPVNACSVEPIRIGEVVRLVEDSVGRRANLSRVKTPENTSSFAIDRDFFMNPEKAESSGYRFKSLLEWFPELVSSLI
jgi:nucleoside-diphosphate-sugar epimerase